MLQMFAVFLCQCMTLSWLMILVGIAVRLQSCWRTMVCLRAGLSVISLTELFSFICFGSLFVGVIFMPKNFDEGTRMCCHVF